MYLEICLLQYIIDISNLACPKLNLGYSATKAASFSTFPISIAQVKCHGASHVALEVKNLPANAEDTRNVVSSSELGRSGGGHSNPQQYLCLEIP